MIVKLTDTRSKDLVLTLDFIPQKDDEIHVNGQKLIFKVTGRSVYLEHGEVNRIVLYGEYMHKERAFNRGA